MLHNTSLNILQPSLYFKARPNEEAKAEILAVRKALILSYSVVQVKSYLIETIRLWQCVRSTIR